MDSLAIWFWLWLFLAAALLVSEMLTVTFFLLPFAVGAMAALVMNILKLDLVVQWVVFLAVSAIAVAAFRPLAKRLTKGDSMKSGAERLVGMDATIIDQPAPYGLRRAKVDGEAWNVELEPGFEAFTSELSVGERVYVMRIDGAKLIVRRYQ